MIKQEESVNQDIKNKEIIKDVTAKQDKKIREGEKLEYYSRKDKLDIKWPTKTELYDITTFETPLHIYLASAPFFSKQQIRCTTDIDTIKKELKEDYGFSKLDKFKDPLLEVIYKIITYDKIKFDFNFP